MIKRCLYGVLGVFIFTGVGFSEPAFLPLPLPEGAPSELKDKGPTLMFTDEGVIRYNLSEDAFINIRIGIQGDSELLHKTVVNWEPRPAGENTEMWDGKDSDGSPVDRGKVVIKVGIKPLNSVSSSFSPYSPGIRHEDGKEEIVPHEHSKHDNGKCKDIKLKLVSPSSGDRIFGVVNVTVEVDKAQCGYGDVSGHGMRVYIDNERIKEEYFPSPGILTIPIDTKIFKNGGHNLTVNVCDHNDHVGSCSAVVDIGN